MPIIVVASLSVLGVVNVNLWDYVSFKDRLKYHNIMGKDRIYVCTYLSITSARSVEHIRSNKRERPL